MPSKLFLHCLILVIIRNVGIHEFDLVTLNTWLHKLMFLLSYISLFNSALSFKFAVSWPSQTI